MLFYDLTYSTSNHTEYVSDIGGFIYQHFYYSPFGEALVSQHANSGRYDTEFRFNGKEQDPELQGASKTSYYYQTTHTLQSRIPLKNKQGYEQTGLYYYGARYYNPRYSIWLSVDPMHSHRSWLTPYNYVQNNPVNLIDPTGMIDTEPEKCPSVTGVKSPSNSSQNFFGRIGQWIGQQITGKGKPSNPPAEFEYVEQNERSVSLSRRDGSSVDETFRMPVPTGDEDVRVDYDMYQHPDALEVNVNGEEILNTDGPVSGTGSSGTLPRGKQNLNVKVTPQAAEGQSSYYDVDLVYSSGPTVFRKTTRNAFFGLIPISKVTRVTGGSAQRMIENGKAQPGTRLQQAWNRRNPIRLR